MKTFLLFAVAIATPFGFAAEKPNQEKLKAEIAQVETAFSAMAQEKGLLAAFEHFAAPDVAFVDTDPRQWRGLEAVRQRLGGTPADLKLSWSPLFVDVSDDGTLGYDYGRYEARRPGPDGKDVVRGGFFLTIWKRQPDGSWRYVMDSGAPDKPSTPAAEKKN
jgi:ketosteroid isomerase-like protein